MVLVKQLLLGINRVDAIVGKTIGARAVALYLNRKVFDAEGDSDELVGNWQGRLADVAGRIGAFHGDAGKHTLFGVDFSGIDAAEGEGGGETVIGHIDALLRRLGSAQFDVPLGHHLRAKQHSHQKEHCGNDTESLHWLNFSCL